MKKTRHYHRAVPLGFMALALMWAWAPSARAFCGFYVATGDMRLYNKASKVVLARDGDRTVLTMSSDFRGDPKQFAVVIPVPVVLENMSLGGARVMLAAPDEFVVCVLRWMDYHAFADVVWREDLAVGLQFDKPLSLAMLEATRLYAEGVPARVRPGEVALRSC